MCQYELVWWQLNCDGDVDHHDPVHFDLQLMNDGNSHFSSGAYSFRLVLLCV